MRQFVRTLVFVFALSACHRGANAPNGGPRDAGTPFAGLDGGIGPASFEPGESDPASHGGTLTFTNIGATGWYPSRRDPDVGPCDAFDQNACCLAVEQVDSDQLTPWDRDLVLTLRGPLIAKQLAVYQPAAGGGDAWTLVSAWDARAASAPRGMAFRGNDTETVGFDGEVGTECLVDVSSDRPFPCGAGSEPFCPSSSAPRYEGWSGSKLIVLLATMPHADDVTVGTPCSDDATGNWWDAPWLGLSLGELSRAGAFSSCQCYAKNPDEWWLGDGCGQFNVFEVVNDNNAYRNLELFSTNFFGYAGYVGEGPCGSACDVSGLPATVDLVDKTSHVEASAGALASPGDGPGVAFRRPTEGYRYFVMLLDVPSRTVQLGIVHPDAVPSAIAELLPSFPASVSPTTIDSVRALRLPN